MTIVATISQRTLQPGVIPPFVSAKFAQAEKWRLTLTPVVWPASGVVLKITTEASLDDQATWRPDASVDFFGPATANLVWTTSIIPGTTHLRVTIEVFQACTLSGQVESL